MKLRTLFATVSAAVVCVVLPGAAHATPAACGTGASHWVGDFGGSVHDIGAQPDEALADVTITNGPAGLVVDFSYDGFAYSPSGNTLQNGLLVFHAYYPPTGISFTSTDVTCAANGTVAGFSGTVHSESGHPWYSEWDGLFELDRS